MKKIVQLVTLMMLANTTTSYCGAKMRSSEERNKLSKQNKIRIDATKKIIAILEANLSAEEVRAANTREAITHIHYQYSVNRDVENYFGETIAHAHRQATMQKGPIPSDYKLSIPDHIQNKYDKLIVKLNTSTELIEYHNDAIDTEKELLDMLIRRANNQYGITYLD